MESHSHELQPLALVTISALLDARRLTSVNGAELILQKIVLGTPKLLDSGILPGPWAALGGDGLDPRLKPHSLWESRCREGALHDRVVFSQSNSATSCSLFVLELRELTGRLVNRDPVTPFPDFLSILEHGVHDPFEHPQSSSTQFVVLVKVQDADAILRHRFHRAWSREGRDILRRSSAP
jgi:hypothetical protein